jgi:hypothetical protein
VLGFLGEMGLFLFMSANASQSHCHPTFSMTSVTFTKPRQRGYPLVALPQSSRPSRPIPPPQQCQPPCSRHRYIGPLRGSSRYGKKTDVHS